LFFAIVKNQAIEQIVIVFSKPYGLQMAINDPDGITFNYYIGTYASVQRLTEIDHLLVNNRIFAERGHSEINPAGDPVGIIDMRIR